MASLAEREPLTGSSIDAAAERRLVRKLDCRMWILVVVFLFCHCDRQSYATARLGGLEDDLRLTPREYAGGMAAFTAAYMLLQVPTSRFFASLVRPSRFIAGTVLAWGCASFLMAATQSYHGLLVCRFVLGAVESSFYPCCTILAVFEAAEFAAPGFSAALAAAVYALFDDHLGVAPWRWLYVVVGGLTATLALPTFLLLPDLPSNTLWLDAHDRLLVEARLAKPALPQSAPSVLAAACNVKLWLLVLSMFFVNLGVSFGQYWPTIARTLTGSRKSALLISLPPFFLAAVVGWVSARASDRSGRHVAHAVGLMGLGILAQLVMVAIPPEHVVLRYACLFAMTQARAMCVPFWAFTIELYRGDRSSSVALALINMLGQSGSFVGAYAWPSSLGPSYALSFFICAVSLTSSALLLLAVDRMT